MNITNLIYVLISVFFFIIGICEGQDFVSSDNFNKKIAKNIVAVEFWVSWNSSNEFADLSELKDCSKYRVDIAKYPELQKEYDVTCIPTVIIFENGEEKERFKANIMFELESNKKEIQGTIDDIMLAKFN